MVQKPSLARARQARAFKYVGHKLAERFPPARRSGKEKLKKRATEAIGSKNRLVRILYNCAIF
jgi:hypothetical protein